MVKLYNTLTRKKEELNEEHVGMYVCGPTVYDEPHIGHARSAYVFDIITRYLRYRGRRVLFVRNVTDVDDKIIAKAADEMAGTGTLPEGASLEAKVKEVAAKYLARYHDEMDALGLLRPDAEPKATEAINGMIEFIGTLIEKGFAYEAEGSVYFNVRNFSDYGKLSGQSLDEMEEGARVALDKLKKDPLDFALWKKAKDNEPSWPSPWGAGRPGWHIECSVMSARFLGDRFLIHGGGIDLVFPHHENEIAQSVCAGAPTAKYWIHNGLLTIDGRKMSKSLGNFVTLPEFRKKYGDNDFLKLLFIASHYRHPVDYTDAKMQSMKSEKERILIFLNAVSSKVKQRNVFLPERKSSWEKLFIEAMDDDFNTPQAISVIFDSIASGNKLLAREDISNEEFIELGLTEIFIRDVCERIFGLSLAAVKNLDEEISGLVGKREEARKNRDFKTADAIRDELLDRGIVIEDTKEGPVWRKKL